MNNLWVWMRCLAVAFVMSPASLALAAGGEFTTVIKAPGANSDTEFTSPVCGTGEPLKVSWLPGQLLDVVAGCIETVDALWTSTEACPAGRMDVFVITPRGNQPPIFAEGIAIRGSVIAFDAFEPWMRSIGPLSAFKSVAKLSVCRTALQTVSKVPGGFCTESRQVAVAFDYGTPLSNRILTNGFSYRLHTVGPVPSDFDLGMFSAEVRNAFQGALTQWTAALSDNPDLLTQRVAEFIASRTLTSDGGFKMLLPPQVIQVACKGNETFVVELNFGGSGVFPAKPIVLARAKIEGRTIAINLAQYKCFRSELKFSEGGMLRFMLDGDCFNLLPIMTHELGHALGLNHFESGGPHALMDRRFFKDALTPTKRDVVALVKVLDTSITGAAPGLIEFMPSNGVSAPEEFESRNRR